MVWGFWALVVLIACSFLWGSVCTAEIFLIKNLRLLLQKEGFLGLGLCCWDCCCLCWLWPDFLSLILVWLMSQKIMSNRFDGLIMVSVPKEWVFVDIKNSDFNDISPVFGSFGLRWVQKCSLKVCRSTVLKLKQAKLPVVWRGAPSVKGGLCRVDVGPYSSFFGMFAAKNRLFSIGFYGKVRFVVWLDSLRSFGV